MTMLIEPITFWFKYIGAEVDMIGDILGLALDAKCFN